MILTPNSELSNRRAREDHTNQSHSNIHWRRRDLRNTYLMVYISVDSMPRTQQLSHLPQGELPPHRVSHMYVHPVLTICDSSWIKLFTLDVKYGEHTAE